MSDADTERRKDYMKSYCYNGKKFLNHLINHVEELENVCLSKLIFKFEKKNWNSKILRKNYYFWIFFKIYKQGKQTHMFLKISKTWKASTQTF